MNETPTPSGEIRPSASLPWTLEPESVRVLAQHADGRLVHVATVADCEDADDQNMVAAALVLVPRLLDFVRIVAALEPFPSEPLERTRHAVFEEAKRILAIADGDVAPPCLDERADGVA